MSNPGDPRPDDGGAYGPAAGGRVGPDGAPPGAPDIPPYVYNPYGNVSYPASYPVPPAGWGPEQTAAPARRPASVHVALLLLLLAAVPFLFSGALAVLGAAQVVATAPAPQLDQLRQLGVDPVQVVRAGGAVLLGVALVFALLALIAWSGRAWARALVAAMTVGFALMLVAVVLLAGQQGGVDAGSLVVIGGPVVLAVVAVGLMFGAAARAWFTRPRR